MVPTGPSSIRKPVGGRTGARRTRVFNLADATKPPAEPSE